MTQSFKAARVFMVHYQQEIQKATPYHLKPVFESTLTSWWEQNKATYPLANFEHFKQNVMATLAYNAANSNR